jgi:hypothetical protein
LKIATELNKKAVARFAGLPIYDAFSWCLRTGFTLSPASQAPDLVISIVSSDRPTTNHELQTKKFPGCEEGKRPGNRPTYCFVCQFEAGYWMVLVNHRLTGKLVWKV